VAVRDVRERGYPALDSLRAIAALSVFFFHAVGFYARGATEGNVIAPYVARLDVGVTIFFLLSGFLLYRPFVQARRQGRPQPPLIPYAWRRALRIVPAYWVALTLATVVLALPGVFTLTGIPTFYGFLQIYDADTAFKGLGQCWTLCVEVSFYAFLPLWAWLVRRLAPGRSLRTELWLLAGLFLAGVLYKALVLGGLAPRLSIFQPLLLALPGFVDHFALGMGLAVLVVGWEERGALPAAVTRAPLLWWAGAATVFLGVAALSGLDATPAEQTHAEYAVRHAANGVVALGLLVPAVAGGGAPGRLLGWTPLRRLGTISYGIFLLHLPFLQLLSDEGLTRWEPWLHPYLLWSIAGLAGTIVLATASWFAVERPALRLKPLAGPWRPPSARPARSWRAGVRPGRAPEG
jgi:peptidoglycan/LPS O-acetylase OafA/YrhL